MEENNQAEQTAAPAAATETEQVSAPSQEADPVKEELERVQGTKRTQKEKLEFTLNRVKKQLAELGAEESSSDDEDRPLTVREFRAMQAVNAQETALTLAEGLDEDSAYKELVKYHLENTVRPSGDPQTDLKNATAIVNGVRNGQIAEEAARATAVRRAPTAPSAPPKSAGKEPELSKEDAAIARGFGLTPEEIAKATT